MNAKIAIGLVLVLALGGGAYYMLVIRKQSAGGGNGGGTTAAGPLTVRPRPVAEVKNSIVDPGYGRKLFQISCAPCHGYEGRGDGAAAEYVWRRPADLTNTNELGIRTDDDLYQVISEGGQEHKRSRLMPQWQTFYNHYERLDLVAYVRTLGPKATEWMPGATKFVRVQSVLPEAMASALKLLPESAWQPARDHTVTFLRGLDGTGGVAGHALFADFTFGGRTAIIGVTLDAAGKIARAGSHEELRTGEVSLDGFFGQYKGLDEAALTALAAAPVAGAEDASKQLAAAIRKTALRLWRGLEQDKAELAVAENPPPAKTDGEKWYRESCADCHGPMGNCKGKGVKVIEPPPRNFLDGSYMNQKQVTRDYLLKVVKHSGISQNISSTMPGWPSLKDEQVNAIIDFMLTLPIPKKQ